MVDRTAPPVSAKRKGTAQTSLICLQMCPFGRLPLGSEGYLHCAALYTTNINCNVVNDVLQVEMKLRRDCP